MECCIPYGSHACNTHLSSLVSQETRQAKTQRGWLNIRPKGKYTSSSQGFEYRASVVSYLVRKFSNRVCLFLPLGELLSIIIIKGEFMLLEFHFNRNFVAHIDDVLTFFDSIHRDRQLLIPEESRHQSWSLTRAARGCNNRKLRAIVFLSHGQRGP